MFKIGALKKRGAGFHADVRKTILQPVCCVSGSGTVADDQFSARDCLHSRIGRGYRICRLLFRVQGQTRVVAPGGPDIRGYRGAYDP